MYSRSQATSLMGESLADSATPPSHLKSFDTITTPITSLAFNPDGQILVAASKDKRDCLKLVRSRRYWTFCASRTQTDAFLARPQYHTESLTTFQNWPTQHTPLGHVTSTGWSPSSEYLAMGNSKGRVLLYRIKPYAGL